MKTEFAHIGAFIDPPEPANSLPNRKLTPGRGLAPTASTPFPKLRRAVKEEIKKLVFSRYEIPYCERWKYDIDHLVPLCLGGTNTFDNLWPHAHDSPYPPRLKGRLERKMLSLIRKGWLTLCEAQNALKLNWVEAYLRFCGNPPVVG